MPRVFTWPAAARSSSGRKEPLAPISGVAIWARDAAGGAPKLYVDMELDGRRVENVIGDDWIINDGGETTIVVNEVKLHDGATGVVPGASAAEWGI